LAKPWAEFERQHDSRYDSDAKPHREDAEPKAIDLEVERIFGFQPKPLDNGQECRKPDRHRWEDDVEADCERELNTRQKLGIDRHRPASVICLESIKIQIAMATNAASAVMATDRPNTPTIAKKNPTPISATRLLLSSSTYFTARSIALHQAASH
jgi:hypothetical protein